MPIATCFNSDPGIGSASPELGYQSKRTSRANGKSSNVDGNSRKTVSGGILRQLELIRERQLKYIRAHKQRLLARLAEDEVEEQRIMEDIDQLKVEILELIEEEEQE